MSQTLLALAQAGLLDTQLGQAGLLDTQLGQLLVVLIGMLIVMVVGRVVLKIAWRLVTIAVVVVGAALLLSTFGLL